MARIHTPMLAGLLKSFSAGGCDRAGKLVKGFPTTGDLAEPGMYTAFVSSKKATWRARWPILGGRECPSEQWILERPTPIYRGGQRDLERSRN